MIQRVHRFTAMGSACSLTITAADGDAAESLALRAEATVAQLEALWSRFRPDSELMVLDEHTGEDWGVGPDTFGLIAAALEAHRRTDGLFDPTLLDALVAAGYDRSFDQLGDGVIPIAAPCDAPVGARAGAGVGPEQIGLDHGRAMVRLPAGLRLDLGGIAKGRAADVVAEQLRRRGAIGACVDLGGDIVVFGARAVDEPWGIAVDDPQRPGDDLALLVLEQGAVATSSRARRRWTTTEGPAHHLIDPRTRRPAVTDLLAVTVVAAEAMWAEVFAKAVLIAGSVEGAALLDTVGLPALLVDESGTVTSVGAMESFLMDAQAPR